MFDGGHKKGIASELVRNVQTYTLATLGMLRASNLKCIEMAIKSD